MIRIMFKIGGMLKEGGVSFQGIRYGARYYSNRHPQLRTLEDLVNYQRTMDLGIEANNRTKAWRMGRSGDAMKNVFKNVSRSVIKEPEGSSFLNYVKNVEQPFLTTGELPKVLSTSFPIARRTAF